MYSKEILEQTFKIPNNKNFDARFEKVYRNHNNEILQGTFRPIPGLFSYAVISRCDKIF